MEKINLNYTTKFLFPLLNISKTLFTVSDPKLNYTRYINSYLHDTSIKAFYKNHIFIVSHCKQDAAFKSFEDTLESLENFVDSYDINDGLQLVSVFKIPVDFRNDYNNFLLGKYSSFSKEAIAKILYNNFDITSEDKRVLYKNIFNKSNVLKEYQEKRLGDSIGDQEVYSIYDEQKNVLTDEIKKSFLIFKSKNKLVKC